MTYLAEVLPFADLLERAAYIIRMDADNIREACTVGGRWMPHEEATREHVAELCALAEQLAKAAQYERPNPWGGPAITFAACADAIRSGEPIDAAMADFGLAWAV